MGSADTDTFDITQYEYDPRPSDVLSWEQNATDKASSERIATIRTSDRIAFRRCRRRWGWNSHLRGNIGPKQNAAPLWMGSGFHFALEDCHGANLFGHPVKAFEAYVAATLAAARNDRNRLPADLEELTALSKGMLAYYWDQWMVARDPLQTYFFKGEPQVEVNFRVDLPWEPGKFGYDRVVYSGTLDRVSIDEHGNLWIVEYKTAKTIQTLHYSNDSQISTYCWAASLIYDRPVVGVIYQQHLKDVPHQPKILANGRISQDKRQRITHRSLREVVKNVYGSVEKAPRDYIDFLNFLATQEDLDSDKFIRRDRIHRNDHQCQAEAVKILMEVDEMLNPDLALYPNPDRSCQFMCPFNGPCVSLDDGSDWEYELDIMMQKRDEGYDRWRNYLEVPTQQQLITGQTNG